MRVHLVAALAAVLCLAGCSSADEPVLSGTQDLVLGPTIDADPTLPPLSVDPAVVWSGPGLYPGLLPAPQIVGDRLVVNTQAGTSAAPVAAIDTATGQTAWTLTDGAELPGAPGAEVFGGAFHVSAAADGLVVVTYRASSCLPQAGSCPAGASTTDEYGVAAVSAATGTVLWLHRLTGGVNYDDDASGLTPLAEVVDVDESSVLVRLTGAGASSTDPTSTEAAVLLDAATGQQTVATVGTYAEALTAQTVVAVAPGSGSATRNANVGAVVGLSRVDGQRLWTTSGDDLFVSGGSGDLVTVTDAETGPTQQTRVLRGNDGSQVATTAPAQGPVVGGGDVVVWTARFGSKAYLASVTSDDDQAVTSARAVGAVGPYLTRGGYVFAEDRRNTKGQLPTETLVLDRSANVIGEPLPGRVVAVGDDFVLLQSFDNTTCSLHRLDH